MDIIAAAEKHQHRWRAAVIFRAENGAEYTLYPCARPFLSAARAKAAAEKVAAAARHRQAELKFPGLAGGHA